jgi:hypothetical protein
VTGPAPTGFQFALKPATSIYYAQSAPGGPPDPRVAFLPPEGAPLPPSLTLPDSWAIDGGVYLFPGAAVASTPLFVAGVRAVLPSQQWAGTRLLWVADPNVPVNDWRLAGIPLVGLSAEGGQLAALTGFSFRNYGCLLNGGLALTVGAGPEFSIAQGSAGDIRLTTDSGGTELPVIDGPVTIPLTGPAAGCLTFAAQLAVGEGADGSIDTLDVGCRFFFDDPDLPGTGLITSRRYPVFDTTTTAAAPGAATAIELAGQLDPNAPLDPGRTCLAFSSSAPLRSFYRTNLGSPLDLAPAGARLQFAVRPAGQQPTDADPLYLVPHGAFTVQRPPAEQAPALLCGVGGAEYVTLAPTPTTTPTTPTPPMMTFVAGQPAYAPGFDPGKTTAVAAQGPRLAGPVSTSWVSVTAPDGPAYFSQPEGAGLFGASVPAAPSTGAPDPGASGPALLPFFELQTAALPSPDDPAAATPYPLVPHAGVSDDLTSYERLEVQVLSQQRRQVIFSLSAAAPRPTPVVPQLRALAETAAQAAPAQAAPAEAVPAQAADPCLDPAALTAGTPQGLIATFSADKSSWACLKLAQSVQEPPGEAPVTKLLALQNIVDPLRSALLTNQQFLVVSDPVAFQPYVGAHNELVIANYRFVLDPAQWYRHGTVMLVKNYRKPLIELIADTNTWVLGTTFNRDVTATQQQLTQIANDGYQSGDDDLAAFVALLTDPAWNGILFLNAYVPLDGFPPELAGLAAGIDPALFLAHHVGINQTPLAADLSQQDSSLFGLISYADSRPLAASGYDFVVRTLKVRFANSAIASFTSRIDLALGQLFGTAVSLPQGGDVLELDGFYQKHGDTGSYVFSEAVPATFGASGDPVLSSVRVIKAEFATLVGPDQAGPTVQTVFSFWGTLAFEALSVGSAALGGTVPFDLFSYDSLVFSGMKLEMSFPSAAPSTRSFRFDPSQMTFDVASSTARAQSLATHFPVTAKGILVSDANKAPGDYGLLPVDTDLDATPFTTPWYALSYDLNLGSAGALAAQAGLVASLVVIWAPGQSALPVSVGLKLPGATGAKNQLTVEGVLKITMFAVTLTYDGTAFLLKLNGIALSLFGKSLPPGGSFDIFVFGDPDPAAGANSLGWYGAYLKDQPTTS